MSNLKELEDEIAAASGNRDGDTAQGSSEAPANTYHRRAVDGRATGALDASGHQRKQKPPHPIDYVRGLMKRLFGEGKTFGDFQTAAQRHPIVLKHIEQMGPKKTKGHWDEVAKIAVAGVHVALSGNVFTEKTVADAFRENHEGQLLFNHDIGCWHHWTGTHWRRERTMLAYDWAVHRCAAVARAEPNNAQARAMLKASAASGVERIAKADRAFAVTSEKFDRDPWLLGTPHGTVDLRTGELQPAWQDEYISKQTATAPIELAEFDPKRDCRLWLAFLKAATGSDAGLIRFLQQWFGYTLTGDVREEALLFGHGPGGSGKSTLVNTIGDLLGDYCVNIPIETLTESKYDRHPTEIARLHGARMAWASETEQGRRWAQKRITELTGGDTITARFMRADFFSFKPQFKLTIIGNNQPSLRSVDAAIKRRFNVAPFRHRPKRVDDTLKARLREEWPGILSWLIVGCLDWQKHGLIRPKVVTDYTREYLSEQDTFQRWLDARCQLHRAHTDTTERLWQSWSNFARREGEDPGSKVHTFPDALREHDFSPVSKLGPKRTLKGWKGLCVRDDVWSSDFPDLSEQADGQS